MRQNAAYIAVLGASAGVGALLVMPGRRSVEAPPPPPTVDAPAPPPTAPPSSMRTSRPTAPPPPTVPSHVRVDPGGATACAPGMLLVDGVYCPYVGHRCASFEDEAHDLCATYAPEAICEGGLQHRRFCIDTYEYPNIAGARPAVWASFDDAKRACAVEGKRLCAAEEWELACEGTGMWPYPYGLSRDASACNDRRAGPSPEKGKLDDPWTRSAEIARVDGRVPSGSQPQCVSPFGMMDAIGNVEEWVYFANGHEKEKPFQAARKGGSWAHGKGRCRPIEASEPGWYRAHDLGFRCCSDAQGSAPAVASVAASGAPGARKHTLEAPR